MKINQSPPTVNTPVTRPTTSGAKTSGPERQAAAELQSTSVRRALGESSDVDMDKVERVRQAIAQGELALDVEALAEAVVGLHRR